MAEDFNSLTCANCGLQFGFSKEVEKIWRDSHKQFFCPNGHGLSYAGPTAKDEELTKLRTEVKELKEKLTTASTEAAALNKKVEELSMELEIWKPSEKTG